MTRPLWVPPDPGLRVGSAAEWHRLAPFAGWVAQFGRWAVGDFQQAAPSHEALVAWIESTPAASTSALAEDFHAAGRFPLGSRRADVPWGHHVKVMHLAAEDRATLLERAAAEELTEQAVRLLAAPKRATIAHHNQER